MDKYQELVVDDFNTIYEKLGSSRGFAHTDRAQVAATLAAAAAQNAYLSDIMQALDSSCRRLDEICGALAILNSTVGETHQFLGDN